MADIITETGTPHEVVNPHMESARRIADQVSGYLSTTPIRAESRGELMKVDLFKPDVRDNIPTRDQGEGFRFWGGIEDGFRWTTYGEPSANIKDLRVPIELRGQGMGKNLVGVWEKAAIEEGVTDFAATNIKDEKALKFWLDLGYVIPEDQKRKPIPYCVVKKIT